MQHLQKNGGAGGILSRHATHCYGGSPEAQTKLHDHFPAKGIWLTECSGGEWQKGNLLVAQADLIIETTRNWGQSVVLWNLALDQNHAPHLGGCADCRGVVTIDHSKSPATVTPTVDFTALAHTSNFVAPGALRIDSTSSEESPLKHVAFRNSDDSRCLQGAYCGLEDAARLWSSAVRSNSALARSRAFISLYNFPN